MDSPRPLLRPKIDEQSLKEIAEATKGKYFRATDEKMLSRVFDEIDSLEKTVLDVDKFTLTDENFMPWVMLSLCAFCATFFCATQCCAGFRDVNDYKDQEVEF